MPERPVPTPKTRVGAPEPTGIPEPTPIIGAPEPTKIPPPPPVPLIDRPGIPPPPPPPLPKPPKPPARPIPIVKVTPPSVEAVKMAKRAGISVERAQRALDIQEATKGYAFVSPQYATRHPEAVVRIGDKYYRPHVSASESRSDRYRGLSSAKKYALKLKDIAKERKYKDELAVLGKHRTDEGYDIAGATLAGVSRRTLDKFFGKRAMTEYMKSAPLEVAERRRIVEEKALKEWVRDVLPTLPQEYQDAYRAGDTVKMDRLVKRYQTKQAEFEASHQRLADNRYVPIGQWNELPKKYQSIGLRQGYDAMVASIGADEARQKAIIATLDEKYEVDGGYNLPLALKRKAVTADDLGFVGFEKSDVGTAVSTVRASIDTKVAVVGEKDWQSVMTGVVYTDAEYKKLVRDFETERDKLVKVGRMYSAEWDKLGAHPSSEMVLTPASGRRLGVQVVSFIAPAARVALPEYTIKDISAIEWGLTGVNLALIGTAFAPGAIMASLAGKAVVTGVATTGSGLLGYNTAKNWADMTPGMRALGVGGTLLYALPLLGTAVRGISLAGVKIPTKGQIAGQPAWRGLSVLRNPVLGKSGGRLVVGARRITLPEARMMLEGYHPQMMLDTKVFVNPSALTRAGFSQVQIKFITNTLKIRNLFAGKKSPYLSKDALIEPTAYVSADEMAVFMKQMIKYHTKVKHFDLLYGGTTIRAQLAPRLRGWRQLHDVDMSTTFKLAEARAFNNETIALFRKLPSKGRYRLSPKSPMRIEKFVRGKWEHISDMKSKYVDPKLQVSELAASKLDATGEYSFGRMVAEPAITVKYPGVGKVDIMAFSESGVRKADTILRVRQTPEGTAFRPPQRGIAKPGVPKDAADFYAIIQTYEEASILKAGTSDAWLKSWARAMGYTDAQLARLFPSLKKAAVEVANKTPSNLIGYRFTPASSLRVSPGATPTIRIHIPSSLGASVSASLASRISTPVSLYAVSPRARASISGAASKVVPSGYPKMISVSELRGLSPSEKASVSVSAKRISPKVSPKPSPRPSPRPSLPPVSVISPRPSPIPPSVPPSALVSVPPSIPPSVPPSPPPPPPTLIPLRARIVDKEARLPEGSIAWRQGVFWKWIPHQDFPTGRKPRTLPKGVTPMGAIRTNLRTPSETIQMIGEPGAPIPDVSIDLGVADIYISDQAQKIKYRGRGLETDVGERVPGATMGMTVGSAEPKGRAYVRKGAPPRKAKRVGVEPTDGYFNESEEWLGSLDPPITRRRPVVNRPRASKKAPRRVRRENTPAQLGGMRS